MCCLYIAVYRNNVGCIFLERLLTSVSSFIPVGLYVPLGPYNHQNFSIRLKQPKIKRCRENTNMDWYFIGVFVLTMLFVNLLGYIATRK